MQVVIPARRIYKIPQRPSSAEVLTTQSSRGFIQYNGARPNNPTNFYGVSGPYFIFQGTTIPINGAVSNQWVPSRTNVGQYEIAKRTIAPPPIAQATMSVLEQQKTLNKFLTQNCVLTGYLNFGGCAALDDFLYGWTDKIKVFAEGIVGSINGGNQQEWNNENLIQGQVPLSCKRIYEVGSLGFGKVAESDIVTEIVDIVYGTVQRCGNCGEQNDGTQWMYAIEKRLSSSAGDAADVVYSTDGGQTWTTVVIGAIGNTVDPSFIDIVGDKLIVGVNAEDAYYYASINQTTGALGSFTKVTTGFVSTFGPTDSYVANVNQVFFSADGGYVYKSTDITSGVTPVTAAGATSSDLARISGDGNNTVIAVGAAGVVIVSSDNGRSWGVGAAPSGSNLSAVECLDSQRFWVGDVAGGLFYSLDRASSWTAKALGDSPAQINDIKFLNDEVGWVAGQTATPTGLLWATFNGGNLWTAANDAGAPRMFGIPATAFQKANRIALPYSATVELAANSILVGGLGATTDGIILQGAASFK